MPAPIWKNFLETKKIADFRQSLCIKWKSTKTKPRFFGAAKRYRQYFLIPGSQLFSQDSRTCFKKIIWIGYLSLSWIEINKNHFRGHKCLDTHIAQEVSKRHWVYPFPSNIGSSIPPFRDMYFHLIAWNNLCNILYKNSRYINSYKTLIVSFFFFTIP